jgi:spore germination cell wall hydrolase CwlJ-like protein
VDVRAPGTLLRNELIMFALAFIVSDIDLMATVITLEENNTKGMYAISEVIYNRAKKDPKRVRKVLLKKYQFTCINNHTVNGKSLRSIVKVAKSRSNWKLAKSIAKNIYAGKVSSYVGNSTHYHVYRGTIKCSPHWTHTTLGGRNKKCIISAFIGDHVYLKNVD